MPDPQAPVTSAAPQISDDVLNKFTGLPDEQKRAALGKMSVGTKQALLAHIKSKSVATPSTTPSIPGAQQQPQPQQAPSKFAQVDQGLQQGVLSGFGLTSKDPNKPQEITASEVGKQLYNGLKQQLAKSWNSPASNASWGLLAPEDMLASGIDSMASTLERGGRDTYQGYKANDPRLMGQGGGEILASLGQIFGGAEGIKKASSTASSAAGMMKNVPLVLKRAKMAERENDFLHSRGVQIAKQVKQSASAVDSEIKTHTDSLQQAIPKNAINASQELTDAKNAFDDVVKTPQAYPPAIGAIAQYVKQHPAGDWDFDTAKQFRSAIGAAAKKVGGPSGAALTRIYVDLTKKMEQSAKAAGPEALKSWNHYNELTKKFYQQSGDLVGDITSPTSGLDVAKALAKDPALSKETINNLGKYGLNVKDVNQYIDQARNILSNKKGFGRSMMRMVYQNPAGFGTFVGARALGAPWIMALPAGIGAGLIQAFIRNLRDVSDLDPKVIKQVENERAFPKPQAANAPPASASPAQAPQAGAAPGGTPNTSAPPQAPMSPQVRNAVNPPIGQRVINVPSQPITPLTTAEKQAARQQVRSGGQADPSATPAAKAPAPSALEAQASKTAGKEAVQENNSPAQLPGVTKVAEGQHGTGQIAQQAKDRIRKAAERSEAAGALPSSGIIQGSGGELGSSVESMPTIEVEGELKSLGKDGVMLHNALQKLRRAQHWDDDTYRGHLIETTTNYLKRNMEKNAKAVLQKETKEEY